MSDERFELPAGWKVTGRCTGKCCERFPLGVDLNASAVEVLAHLRDGTGPPRYELEGQREDVSYEDGAFILDMLLPIQGPQPADAISQNWFTCRHFDGTDCTVYDDRPSLCRRHGVTTKCDHKLHGTGCTIEVEKPDVPVGDLVKKIDWDEKVDDAVSGTGPHAE